MAETNLDLSYVQETPRQEPHLPTRINTSPVPTPNTAASTEQHPLEQAVDADLVRAKLGVERFKADFEAGDEEWKRLLTQTVTGEALQAMYLGLKPATMLNLDLPNDALVAAHVAQSQQFSVRGHIIYDRNLVAHTIEANHQFFRDYQPDQQTIDEYLEQLHTAAERDEITDEIRIQNGLLCGFPQHAVLEYVNNDSIARAFRGLYETQAAELSAEERALLEGYAKGYPDVAQDSAAEVIANVNKFRNDHAAQIKAFIETRLLSLPDTTRNYLHTQRVVTLPGFTYLVGNPTPEDRAFEQKVRDIFEQSGMTAFVVSVRGEK
jgi:hypothetical protein